jgi:hypothetical protein
MKLSIEINSENMRANSQIDIQSESRGNFAENAAEMRQLEA